jgi:hypothetical protein
MDLAFVAVIGVVVIVLLFDYTNNFHDVLTRSSPLSPPACCGPCAIVTGVLVSPRTDARIEKHQSFGRRRVERSHGP